MKGVHFVARVAFVACVCALATTWFGWPSLPFVGFIYGAVDRRARARGTTAALGAAVGWLGMLGAEAARGADVRAVATQVGAVLQVPGSVFTLAALIFAALLCGTAAVLGASFSDVNLHRVGRTHTEAGSL